MNRCINCGRTWAPRKAHAWVVHGGHLYLVCSAVCQSEFESAREEKMARARAIWGDYALRALAPTPNGATDHPMKAYVEDAPPPEETIMPRLRQSIAIGISLTLPAFLPLAAPASLSVHPGVLEVAVVVGEPEEAVLHVTNDGPASPLGFSIEEDRTWLSASPSEGDLLAGQQVTVAVTMDPEGLAPGIYSATITVLDPHHGGITVPVTLRVTTPTPVDQATWGAIKGIYR